MKNKILPLVLIVILSLTISSCSLLVRFAGFKNPKVETKESVQEYLNEIESPFEYTYILKSTSDSLIMYNNLFSKINTATLYNSQGSPLAYDGSATCGGTQLSHTFEDPESYYETATKDSISLNTQLSSFVRIDANKQTEILPKADYYYVIYWSKFFGKKKNQMEDFIWTDSSRLKSDKNIVVLLVNTDMQESWGLKKEGKIKLKMHTEKSKDGSRSTTLKYKEKNLRMKD